MKLFWVVLLSTIAAAQGTKIPGPLTITPDPSGASQEAIILVDIGKPVPPPAAGQYILSFDNGATCPAGAKCYQESDNGGAYHTLAGPKGIDGTNGVSPTITVGTVSSGATAAVWNTGTAGAALFNFVLPKGDKGDSIKGDPGTAATVAVGTVISGAAPAITNAGTPQDAIFNFVLQPGPKGADSFPVGSSITVVVTGCNVVAAGRTCVFRRTK